MVFMHRHRHVHMLLASLDVHAIWDDALCVCMYVNFNRLHAWRAWALSVWVLLACMQSFHIVPY